MGNASIKEAPLFIIKEYKTTYASKGKKAVYLSKSDLGVEDISGYKIFGVQQYIPGELPHRVFSLFSTDTEFVKIYNYSSTDYTNSELDIWITWIREDAVLE